MTETTPARRLRAAGLRATATRVVVLQVMAAAPQPLCAKAAHWELQHRGIRVSLSTVYRALHQLEAAGLLACHRDARGTVRYWPCLTAEQGPRTAPLQLRCATSGRTAPLADARLHAHLLAVAGAAGWDLTGQRLVIEAERPVLSPAPRPAD